MKSLYSTRKKYFSTGQSKSNCEIGIYRRTNSVRAAQPLLGHAKVASTARHLGIDVDATLEMADDTEV